MTIKEIIKTQGTAIDMIESARISLETMLRMGEKRLSKEECRALDDQLTLLNMAMAHEWKTVSEFQKIAPPEEVVNQ